MTDNLKMFLKYASKSPDMKRRLKTLGMCDKNEAMQYIIRMAKEEDLELEPNDFYDSVRSIEEYEDLIVGDGVPKGCYCVKTGTGDGVRSVTDGIFSCSCISFGEGSDNGGFSVNCMCALLGEGDSTDL